MTTPPDRTIHTATTRDLAFVIQQQRDWSSELGFLPTVTHRRYIEKGQVLIIRERGQPAGFCNWTLTRHGLLRIPQVAIHHDLLRLGIGSDMIRHLTIASRNHASIIRLTSRAELPCNQFWPTIGFASTSTFTPNTTRGHPLIEWTLPLHPHQTRQILEEYAIPATAHARA
jgi:hypothetical protein